MSLAAKIFNAIGKPIEKGFELLPANWSDVVNWAPRTALKRALDIAVAMIDDCIPAVKFSISSSLLAANLSFFIVGSFFLDQRHLFD
jgi:hypothetical protein